MTGRRTDENTAGKSGIIHLVSGKIKAFALGVVVTAIIFCVAYPALAETALQNILVAMGDIKIYVDGQLQNPTDAKGNTVEPMIYDGTTYLPVRALTGMLTDKAVNWDQDTHSVYIGAIPEQSPMVQDILDSAPAPLSGNHSQYSANGITVKLEQPQYDTSWGGNYYSGLSFENYSASDIHYVVECVKVNGFQLPSLTFGDVYSGMRSDEQVFFPADDLKLAKIDHILNVELRLKITEAGSKNQIDTITLSVATPEAEIYTQSYDFGWPEVYNENGLRICARLGEAGESYAAVFYIDNHSGKEVSLSYHDIAINNVMVGVMMSGTRIESGAKCVTGMQRAMLKMMGETIPENQDIQSVVLKFSFLPARENNSFSTADLFYSNKITISR